MTVQRISVIAPCETHDDPETGGIKVEGNYNVLNNLRPENFNRLAPLESVNGRLRGTQISSGTLLAKRKNFQSVLTDDYFTCPVFDTSNRMTSEAYIETYLEL